MGSDSKQLSKIPKTDLTGLHPSLPGGENWEAAKAAIAAALLSHGCFEANYPSLSPDIREAMFGGAVPELFALPLEAKLRISSDDPYHGYVGQIPHLVYESLPIKDAQSPAAVEEFTKLMWPEGNRSFCNTVVAFTNPLHELMEMLQRIIPESLGVGMQNDSLFRSITYGFRVSEYGVPLNQETKLALDSHVDPNLVTVICQNKIDGLQIQTISGDWVNVEPSPTSVIVMVGQAFKAWSNMRVRAPSHRVKILGNEKRFSAIYFSQPSRNSIVESPEELVDDEHPLLYKPFNYTEFLKFYFSEKDSRLEAVNAYCGIRKEAAA